MDTLLSKKNVLEVEYDSTAFKVEMLIIFFAAITTIPLLMLPAKNDVEAIDFNNKTMTTCLNIIVTVCLVRFVPFWQYEYLKSQMLLQY